MQWSAWEPTYRAICEAFGYAPELDAASALDLLAAVRAQGPNASNSSLQARLHGNLATVVGCGPGLESLRYEDLQRPVIAADGASERLMELDFVPDVVVTDLDGKPEALQWASTRGALMVVHAHGNNAEAIRTLAPTLRIALGTHQVEPTPDLEPLANLGGFTDGDRSVLLAEAMGSTGVQLLAFETAKAPSRYTHRYDPEIKPLKLAWAQRIVDAAAERGFKILSASNPRTTS